MAREFNITVTRLSEWRDHALRGTQATMTEARPADPLLAALIAAGHATAGQVDDLFREAAQV